MRRVYFKNNRVAALMVAPQLLVVFIFFYWPASQAIYWAFTLEQPWGGGSQWVGLDNLSALLADPQYWEAVITTLIYAAATTFLSMSMALILAVFADRQLTGYRVWRIAAIWPYAVAAPAVGLAFRFIFNPSAGVVSYLNQIFPNFWDPSMNGTQAMIMIIIAGAWKQISYNFIFFLAGLQAIPRPVIEAAAMDGAGPMRRIWDMQLPLIAPTFFFILVMNIADSFTDSFGIVDIMTEGGPGRATDLMVYKIYTDGFQGLDYSGAAAQSVILMLLVIALTFIQFRFVERRVHYS